MTEHDKTERSFVHSSFFWHQKSFWECKNPQKLSAYGAIFTLEPVIL